MDTEEESRVYKSVHQSNKILQYLYENRHKPHSMCDMMLVAVDQTFPVHRAVVAAASPHIRSLLIDSVTEGIYSSVLLLSEYIPITSSTLESLVSYIYKGSIELCSDNVDGMMEAAVALQMEELKGFCQEYKELLSSLKKTTQPEEKTSKSVAAWNVHMRPYSCKYCLQNFPKLDAYKRHCRRHEKIYHKHWLKKLRSESSRANRRSGSYSLRGRRKLKVTDFQLPEDEDDDERFNYDAQDQDDEDTDFIIDENLEMDKELEIDETLELTSEVRSTSKKKARCPNGHGRSVGQAQGPITKGHAESVDQTDSSQQPLRVDSEENLYSSFRGCYKCNLCPEKFHLKTDILRHITDHKPWKCTICNTHFRTREQLHIHQKVHKDSQYKCPACPRKFSRARYFNAHLRGHSNPAAITCCHCNESFRSRAKLDWHLLNEHSQYQCSICQKACSCQSQLATHLLVHQKERPYICHKCGKSFKQKHNFLTHERQVHHGRKLYKCDYCHRTFKGRGCLRIHLHQHTGEKPFKCNQCDERFLYKYKLKKHEKFHESGDVEVIKVPVTKKKAPRKILPKTTPPKRKSDRLNSRSSTVVEQPPEMQPRHQCDHCEESFMYESGLTAHLRTDHMIQTMPNLKSLLGVNLFLDDW